MKQYPLLRMDSSRITQPMVDRVDAILDAEVAKYVDTEPYFVYWDSVMGLVSR